MLEIAIICRNEVKDIKGPKENFRFSLCECDIFFEL